MKLDELKAEKILRGPIFHEPVQVVVTVPMGDAVKIVAKGVSSARVYDPATLDWQPIVKVEHYRLRQDSVKHPVELKEASPEYRVNTNDHT